MTPPRWLRRTLRVVDFCTGFIVGALAVTWIQAAHGHPGGLDTEGCHVVHEDFVYTSGIVAKKGSRHCHRHERTGEIILDGHEVLRGPHEGRDDGVHLDLEQEDKRLRGKIRNRGR